MFYFYIAIIVHSKISFYNHILSISMLCCGCSYSWPSKHKQLSRLAFWEQDDLSYACLYPQKHFVPPSFVFLCCGCSYSWPSKHKQLSRLAFWEQDDLSYACLYPQKHFVPPSFVFFCFSPRQIGSGPTKQMVQKAIGCEDPRDRSMSEKEIMPILCVFCTHYI